jgi:hypothetical protein
VVHRPLCRVHRLAWRNVSGCGSPRALRGRRRPAPWPQHQSVPRQPGRAVRPGSRHHRSNRMTLINRGSAAALHRRRSRKATHIRDHTAYRHDLCRGCGRKVTRSRDDATALVCHRPEKKGITEQRHTIEHSHMGHPHRTWDGEMPP